MGNAALPPPDRTTYFGLIAEEDQRLADTLAAIRADRDAGQMTEREAADNQIAVLEIHLTRCADLRRQYLGEGG